MKNYGFHSNQEYGWNSTSSQEEEEEVEYNITNFQRMPSEVFYTPPSALMALNNKFADEEEEQVVLQQVHHHHHKHHAPPPPPPHHDVQKKVHFVENKRFSTSFGEGGGVVKGRDINMEADGFIKQRHKSFEQYI